MVGSGSSPGAPVSVSMRTGTSASAAPASSITRPAMARPADSSSWTGAAAGLSPASMARTGEEAASPLTARTAYWPAPRPPKANPPPARVTVSRSGPPPSGASRTRAPATAAPAALTRPTIDRPSPSTRTAASSEGADTGAFSVVGKPAASTRSR